jgi:integrase
VAQKSTKAQGVYQHTLKDGSLRYEAVVDLQRAYGKGRLQKRRRFETLKAARDWRTEQLGEVLSGRTDTGGSRTLGWWVSEWLELREGDLEFATARNYRRSLDKFVNLYRTPLNKLLPADIEVELVRIRQRHAHRTSVEIRKALSVCLNAAVNLGLIGRNPVRGTSVGRPDRGAKYVWDAAQVKVLLDGTSGDEVWGAFWRTLAETWMRVGEACGLRWEDIDFGRREIHVKRTARMSADGWVVGDTAKTRTSVRVLPFSDELARMLLVERDRARFRGEPGRVFATHPDHARQALHRACNKIGIERIGPHMLRHAGATMAARAGMDPRIIQQRLGHTSVAFTMQRYVWPNQDDHRQAADLVTRLLG